MSGTSNQKRPNVTIARVSRYIVRMDVTGQTDSSTVLRRRQSTAIGIGLSASTVRHHILKSELMVRMALHWLPLSRKYQRFRLEWPHERGRLAKHSVFGRVPNFYIAGQIRV